MRECEHPCALAPEALRECARRHPGFTRDVGQLQLVRPEAIHGAVGGGEDVVTYGAACSLDGFITDGDGKVDWLHFSKDAQEVMAEYWGSIDTLLMGRRTWEVAQSHGGGVKRKPKRAKTSKPRKSTSGITTYVFSRTLSPDDLDGAELVSDNAGDFVLELKRQAGKGICVMGGGILASSLFAAGVIDEVGLNIHPILLGRGAPMFIDPGARVALELTSARSIDGGCVLANYRVRKA